MLKGYILAVNPSGPAKDGHFLRKDPSELCQGNGRRPSEVTAENAKLAKKKQEGTEDGKYVCARRGWKISVQACQGLIYRSILRFQACLKRA
jgi:hypothetical protein